MSELWLNHETLIRLTNWSDRTIREKRQHNEVVFRERPGRERNGRRAFEYAASSLPPEGQRKMYRLQLAASTAADTTQALTTPAAQSALFLPSDAEAGNARIALSPEQRKIAEQRLAPVKTMMEVKRRLHARSPMTITLGDGRMIDTERAWADYLGEAARRFGADYFSMGPPLPPLRPGRAGRWHPRRQKQIALVSGAPRASRFRAAQVLP